MKELNLHGCSYYDLKSVLESFVLMNDAPFRIITDKSEKMKTVAESVLKEHKFQFHTSVENTKEIIVTY